MSEFNIIFSLIIFYTFSTKIVKFFFIIQSRCFCSFVENIFTLSIIIRIIAYNNKTPPHEPDYVKLFSSERFQFHIL